MKSKLDRIHAELTRRTADGDLDLHAIVDEAGALAVLAWLVPLLEALDHVDGPDGSGVRRRAYAAYYAAHKQLRRAA